MNPPPRKSPDRYRLYVDESGDHGYGRLDDVPYQYLALLGVWFRQADDYVAFADRLADLKRAVFGARPDSPVHLHRKDIIQRRGAFGILQDAETRRRFDDGIIDVIAQSRFRMVCVVIDKKAHRDRYSTPFHPYHYCLAAMLERYSGWLNYKNAVGDVMAESRGATADRQLKQAYLRVYESGTLWTDHEFHAKVLTSKELKVRPKSANVPGLELADLLAHPLKQLVLFQHGIIRESEGEFAKRIQDEAAMKFNYKEGTARIAGYGTVWL